MDFNRYLFIILVVFLGSKASNKIEKLYLLQNNLTMVTPMYVQYLELTATKIVTKNRFQEYCSLIT